jgi:hypothetical protein
MVYCMIVMVLVVMVLVRVGGTLVLRSRRPQKLMRPATLRHTKQPQKRPTGPHTALRPVPSSSIFRGKRGTVLFLSVDLLLHFFWLKTGMFDILGHGISGIFVGGKIHFWSSSCSSLKLVVEESMRRNQQWQLFQDLVLIIRATFDGRIHFWSCSIYQLVV